MPKIAKHFDRETFRRVCTMPERMFGTAYDMERVDLNPRHFPHGEDFFFFKDHGASILAVAHLDTVGGANERDAHFLETEGGTVVYSRALDDRLGAYTILEWLPSLGVQHDILLTVGEESGNSTASAFEPPEGKEYDWIIEFDRGGTDVVMYQYDDADTRAAVRSSGARVGDGIFSDICYLEHLGVKGFNWGTGYRDYHGPRAHAYLDDTNMMLGHYLKFLGQNDGLRMPHKQARSDWWSYNVGDEDLWEDDDLDTVGGGLWSQGDHLDRDWIEYPTNEELRAIEAAEDAAEIARLSEVDR